MGARGNIRIQHADEGHIWLYTHWHGHEIVDIASDGLRAARDGGRLTDPSYATRIIIETMLSRASDKFTGFGIHAGGEEPDNNYPPVEIVWDDHYGEPEVVYMGRVFTVSEFIEFSLIGVGG